VKQVACYICPTCGATKEIINDSERTGVKAPVFPARVICGWRGCDGYALPKVKS